MRVVRLILIICCFNSASAQWVLSHDNFNIFEYTNELLVIANDANNKSVSSIVGSPYINEAFLPVKFTSFGDKVYYARFNAYDGSMEVTPTLGEKPIAITKNNKDLEVNFSTLNKTYRTYEYFDYGQKIDFFVNVLILENVSLLKKEEVKLTEEIKAITPMNVSRPSEFKRLDDKFFLKTNNSELKLISSKKEIVELFPKHEKAVSSFIKDNKLKLKDETDLKTLVTFLNKLD